MINWQATKEKFGLSSEDKILKNQKIVCNCDICGLEILATKQRHYQYIYRVGIFRCKKCGIHAMKQKMSMAIKKKWEEKEYQEKQKIKKHSESLKEAARLRSIHLWQDKEYKKKFKENFNPNMARENLKKAHRSTDYSVAAKKLWEDPEYRKKAIEANKEKWLDEEYRDNIINKLQTFYSNPENKLKLSEAIKEKWLDEEYRDKCFKSLLASMTDERRREISEQSILNWQNFKYRKDIESKWTKDKREWMGQICNNWWTKAKRIENSELMLLKWQDNNFRRQMTKIFKERWEDPEFREKMAMISKERWEDPEFREKMTKISKERWEDLEFREKMTKISKERWEDPEFRKKMAIIRAQQSGKPSSIQLILYSILEDLGIKHFREYSDRPNDFECTKGPWSFDCFLPDHGLLIECQGIYWHGSKHPEKESRDEAKASYVLNNLPDLQLKYINEDEFSCRDMVRGLIKLWCGLEEVGQVIFSFKDIKIKAIDVKEARLFVAKYHYAGSLGNNQKRYGAYYQNKLIALCVFGSLTRKESATRLGYKSKEMRELTRFCIHPSYQKKNFASWLISKSIKLVKKELLQLKCLISFADTTYGHVGIIYKASNWEFDGEVKPSYWYLKKDGWIMHKKTLWDHAIKMSMKEREFAEKYGYKKVKGKKKLRYLYKYDDKCGPERRKNG